MNKEILKIKNLSKKYYNDQQSINVIKNINAKIKEGELISLIGPSGSGKSTLLHLIGLLDRPTSGDIFFKGVNMTKSSENKKDEIRKKNISIIYQQNNLLGDFTVLENVIIPLIINGETWKKAEKKAKKILSNLNLIKRLDHFPNQISGGEEQRTAVARAIITEPELILADEPTGSLDKKNAEEVFSLFLKLRSKNRAIIYATHNRDLANKADYKLSILDGRVKKLNG